MGLSLEKSRVNSIPQKYRRYQVNTQRTEQKTASNCDNWLHKYYLWPGDKISEDTGNTSSIFFPNLHFVFDSESNICGWMNHWIGIVTAPSYRRLVTAGKTLLPLPTPIPIPLRKRTHTQTPRKSVAWPKCEWCHCRLIEQKPELRSHSGLRRWKIGICMTEIKI